MPSRALFLWPCLVYEQGEHKLRGQLEVLQGAAGVRSPSETNQIVGAAQLSGLISTWLYLRILMLDVAIKANPIISMTTAIRVVLSPIMSPSIIKNAATNAKVIPSANCATNRVCLFIFILREVSTNTPLHRTQCVHGCSTCRCYHDSLKFYKAPLSGGSKVKTLLRLLLSRAW